MLENLGMAVLLLNSDSDGDVRWMMFCGRFSVFGSLFSSLLFVVSFCEFEPDVLFSKIPYIIY